MQPGVKPEHPVPRHVRSQLGYHVGDAIAALFRNGVDERKRIIGTEAPTPYLFNVPAEFIDRVRERLR